MSNPVLPEKILHYIGGKHLPSVDGATFATIEAAGLKEWLAEIRRRTSSRRRTGLHRCDG